MSGNPTNICEDHVYYDHNMNNYKNKGQQNYYYNCGVITGM